MYSVSEEIPTNLNLVHSYYDPPDLKLECKHDGSKITAMAVGALGRKGGKEPLSHCRQLPSLRATHQGRSKGPARLLQLDQYQSRNGNQATRSKKQLVQKLLPI